MTFTVTYRGADGAPKAETVEAASRTECLAQMKARGVAVLCVKEGGGRDKARPSRHSAPERDGKDKRDGRDKKGKGRKVVAYVLFVVFVALAVGGAWWWLGRNKAQPAPEPELPKKSAALPKEVTPAAAPKSAPEPAPEPTKKAFAAVTNEAGIPIGKNGKPLWLYPPPPMHRPCVTTGTHSVQSIQERVFVHPSDQMVASLLMMQPGDILVGESEEMFVGFKDQFLKSLETPIVIEDTDTDFVKELKASVRDLRKELKDRLDAGEDIENTLAETRRELRSLGLYREELKEHLKELGSDKEMTEQDMRDFVKAANMMLKERGAREIEMPEMLLRRLRLQDVRRRSESGR